MPSIFEARRFPVSAGIFLGIGLGGFFDSIVLRQLLQWHRMLGAGPRPASAADLSADTFWSGVLQAGALLFIVAGMVLLWRAAHRVQVWWSGKMLSGSLLIGFGLYNILEGLIGHHLLGIHHVNESVPPDQRLYWDAGFLACGVLMLLVGRYLLREGQRETEQLRQPANTDA